MVGSATAPGRVFRGCSAGAVAVGAGDTEGQAAAEAEAAAVTMAAAAGFAALGLAVPGGPQLEAHPGALAAGAERRCGA